MPTSSPASKKRSKHLRLALGVSLVVSLAAVGAAVAIDRLLTKGPIPSNAFVAGKPVDASKIPDFVPALARDGEQAGYVAKQDLAIYNGKGDTDPMPVYANDLVTVVGHMVAGVGYVPLGTDAGSLPTFSITTSSSQDPNADK